MHVQHVAAQRNNHAQSRLTFISQRVAAAKAQVRQCNLSLLPRELHCFEQFGAGVRDGGAVARHETCATRYVREGLTQGTHTAKIDPLQYQ